MGRISKRIKHLLAVKQLSPDERVAKLEKETYRKLNDFEDSLSTFRDVIMKLEAEKQALKSQNLSLKQKLGIEIEELASDVNDLIIQPVIKEGRELADLVLDNKGTDKEYVHEKRDDYVEVPQEESKGIEVTNTDETKPETKIIARSNLKSELKGPAISEDKKKKTVLWLRGKFGLPQKMITKKSKKKKKTSP